ncbi:MAG: hypothetical protein WCS43_18070 [Verrucomicrobiota bacterium]|jgi:hypothetical protein
MAGTIQEILASRNLIGRVVDIVNGVPEDILPKGFLTANRTTEGDRGEYLRVAGTRQTSTISRYGSPAKDVAPIGIGSTPVKLLHSFETFSHDPTVLNLLIEETGTGLVRQQMAKETINRQLDIFGQRFRNLRISAVMSALTTGGIAFDSSGNLLPPDSSSGLINSSAAWSINFGVPSGNTAQLNVFGTGNLLTNWKAATPNILGQLKAVKKAGRKLTGHPITHAFYGVNIPGYIAADPVLQSIIRGSQRVAEEAITAEIPSSVGNLKWFPIDQAFFVDQAGVAKDWAGDDVIVFTPDPSTDWWEVIEGTYPVPRSIQLANDLGAVLGNLQQVAGPFSYAQVTTNPVSLQHFAGDTFLPIIKNPAAVFIAKVPTS